jgi:phosphoribosylformylglycinamidine synthase
VLVGAVAAGELRSAGSVGRGGLMAALVQACVGGGRGASVALPTGMDGPTQGQRLAQELFSEAPGRVLVSVGPDHSAALAARCAAADVDVTRLGTTGGGTIVIEGVADLPLDAVRRAHLDTLPAALGELTEART